LHRRVRRRTGRRALRTDDLHSTSQSRVIHRSRREPKLEPHAPPCLHPPASRAAVGRAEGRGALRYTDACRGGIVRFIVYGALFIATALPSCSRLDASPSGHVAAAARARAPAVAT